MKTPLILAALALLIQGCTTAPYQSPSTSDGPGKPINPSSIADAVPQVEPKSRYGNTSPYRVNGQYHYVLDDAVGYHAKGVASWYGKKFHGNKTSTREIFDMYEMTAAHRNLPLPTYAWVKNLENGRTVIVKINDRGPFIDDRLIDLSYAAAVKLGFAKQGTARVEVVAITEENINGRLAQGGQGTRAKAGDMPTARTIAVGKDSSQARQNDFTMQSIQVTPGVTPNVTPSVTSAVSSTVAATEAATSAAQQSVESSAQQAQAAVESTPQVVRRVVSGDDLPQPTSPMPAPTQPTPSSPVVAPLPAPAPSEPSQPPVEAPSVSQPVAPPPPSLVPPPSVAKPIELADSRYLNPQAQVGGQGLYVQLGAFGLLQNASALRARVAGRTAAQVPVFVQQLARGNQQFYRVRMGPLLDRASVTSVLSDLQRAGIRDYKVMQDTQWVQGCVEGCVGP